ncbi:MAG: tetratricopeptide repeat protein [Bacteroidota bacterium]
MRVLLSFIIFLSTLLLSAQTPNTEQAQSWTQDAMQYLDSAKPDSAHLLLERALTFYQDQDDLKTWIRVFRQAGANAQQRGASEEAIAYYTEAIQRPWRRAKDSLEWANRAWVFANRGFTYSSGLGNFQKGIEDYEACRKIFVDTLQQEDLIVARYVYTQLGNMYTRIGDYEKSLFYLGKVRDKAIDNGDSNLAAEAFGDMGIAYESMDNRKEALKAYQEGLALEDLGPMASSFLYNNMAVQYSALGQYQKALKSNQEAERIIASMLKEPGAEGQRRLQLRRNANRQNFGHIYSGLEEYPRAADYYTSLIQEAVAQYGTSQRREVGKLYIDYGQLFEAWGKTDSALYYYQKALHCVLPNFTIANPLTNPNAASFYPENTILEALQAKAHLLATQSQGTDQLFLKKALECHELIFVVEEQLRQRYQYESSKLALIKERRQRTEQAIELAHQLWQLTDEEDYLQKAFRYAEQSKAIVLLESLKKLGAQNMIGIPDSLLELERSLRQTESDIRVASIEERLKGKETDQDLLKKYRDQLFQIEQQQQDLSKTFSEAYPQYYRRKYQLAPIRLSHLQENLKKEGQCLIEYFIGDRYLFAFAIAGNRLQLIRSDKPEQFEQQLDDYRTLIKKKWQERQEVDRFCQQSHALYQSLIAPLEIAEKRLIIIPDGQLSYLPFETLLTAKSSSDEMNTLPYLLIIC